MHIITFLILSILLFLPMTSKADFISHNGFTLNTETNIVNGGGLEWIQWDETLGQSVNTALQNHSSDGWRLATNADMAGLFNAFFPSSLFGVVWDDDKTTNQIVETPWTADEDSVQNGFISLFGITNVAVTAIGISTDQFVGSSAFFGDANSPLNIGSVFDDWTRASDGVQANGIMNMNPNVFSGSASNFNFTHDSTNTQIGVALIRNVQTQSSPIPEPAGMVLFLLGMVSLITNRKSRCKLFG